MATLANLIALILATAFGLSGLAHISAPGVIVRAYRRWEFPRAFHTVAGIAQLVAALFLYVPQTRIWGGILAGMILFVAVVSLLNHRKYAYAVPAILVLLAIAPAMAAPL